MKDEPTVVLIKTAIIEARRARMERLVLYLLEMALIAAEEAEQEKQAGHIA